MNIVELIRKKRDAKKLTNDEIFGLIEAYSSDSMPDYQMSAFLMAGFLNGLDDEEAASLTQAMLESGKKLDLSGISGKKVDKHSTGGVGDKLSLILAPIVASCGVNVPMISGRGLGHTGGTLDKMESITGFNVDISLSRFKEIAAKHGLVMAGQTEDVAPADKRMYALRDVTATVEYIPYIASSIMSKKLAEDIDGLVLDVKFGSGAFMKTAEQARELAETLVNIGESFDTETIAYLTAMEQPLGHAVGNWLEAKEAFESLEGQGPADVMEITHLLAGSMIYLGGAADTVETGIAMSKESVSDGSARDKWIDLVDEHGGDSSLLKNPDRYPKAEIAYDFSVDKEGYISHLDAFTVGLASLELGAGRKKKDDTIVPEAGIYLHKKRNEYVTNGDTVATLYTNSEDGLKEAISLFKSAIKVSDESVDLPKLIHSRVDREGVHNM